MHVSNVLCSFYQNKQTKPKILGWARCLSPYSVSTETQSESLAIAPIALLELGRQAEDPWDLLVRSLAGPSGLRIQSETSSPEMRMRKTAHTCACAPLTMWAHMHELKQISPTYRHVKCLIHAWRLERSSPLRPSFPWFYSAEMLIGLARGTWGM